MKQPFLASLCAFGERTRSRPSRNLRRSPLPQCCSMRHWCAARHRVRAGFTSHATALSCSRPRCAAVVWSQQEQLRLTEDLALANESLELANESFVISLVTTLDARDEYTAGHSTAVAIYARDIAERLGLSDEQQQLVHHCGEVHDMGKIGLPPGLLEKPGALTSSRRTRMETHSEIGERILAKVEGWRRSPQLFATTMSAGTVRVIRTAAAARTSP